MSIELLIVSADHVLFQAKAQHAAGLAAATHARSEAAPASAISEDFCAAYQEAFVQASTGAKLSVRRQTEQLMRETEQAGARLAIVTMMSSRMLSALLDRYDQPACTDRFAVTATADSLGHGRGHADLLRLVLHAVDVPADRALFVGANAGEASAAATLGMPSMWLHDDMAQAWQQDEGATILSDAPTASWPSFDDIEMRFTQGALAQTWRYTRLRTLAAPA
ncbi:HAD family hydrolase [Cupriavidus sp. L7L]|uniref:HAD family hydrolase n=1 Tax=Cupriavidus sp. L7L TaxID=2546443 RepID=UPI001404FED2|nr:HAD family hydrolase [Cupriavidus sp. L7L]